MLREMQKKQVDIVAISLKQPDNVINALYWYLTDEEKNQLLKFPYTQERNRFIICQGAVRQILSKYLEKPSSQIEIKHSQNGKPIIHKKGGGVEIQFSLAHSEDMAVCALSPDINLGVDIQFMHPFINVDRWIVTNFTEEEREYFYGCDQNSRLNRLFTLWARKEAFINAIGQGLSFPLKECSVLDGKNPTHFKEIKLGWRTSLMGYWFFTDLTIMKGYASALVIEAPKTNVIRHYQWTMDFTAE